MPMIYTAETPQVMIHDPPGPKAKQMKKSQVSNSCQISNLLCHEWPSLFSLSQYLGPFLSTSEIEEKLLEISEVG